MTDRTHFARLLTTKQVNSCLDMLASVCDGPLADLMTRDDETIIVKAPDGDEVFRALKKGSADAWICRLHTEVFTQ
jgi:hypothetical protein